MPYSARQVFDLQAERDKSRYAGMTDAAFLALVTLEDVAVPRETSTKEIFDAIVDGEMPLRNTQAWDQLMMIAAFNAGESVQMGGGVLSALRGIFAAGTTRTNLEALATELKSPIQIAGLPAPILADIARTS